MNCEKYQRLIPKERAEFIGYLLHAVQNDNELFDLGAIIINKAEVKGLYENITIMPPRIEEPPTENY